MKVTVPESLITMINRESLVDYKPIDVLMNLEKAIQLISKYEAEHNHVPTEWTLFMEQMRYALTTLTNSNKEIAMSKTIELEAKRTEWITKIVFNTSFDEATLRSLSMVELRDLYEEVFPSYVVATMATATGVRKVVTKLKVG